MSTNDTQPKTSMLIQIGVLTAVYVSYQVFGFQLTIVYLLALIALFVGELVEQVRHD